MKDCVEVIVQVPAREVDRVFHYLVPEVLQGRVRPGVRVKVPFGRRTVKGFITGFSSPPDGLSLKPIGEVLDEYPVLTTGMLTLARWLSQRYLARTEETLDAMVPPETASAKFRAAYQLAVSPEEAEEEANKLQARAPKQAAILRFLAQKKTPLPAAAIERASQAGHSSLAALIQKGLVTGKNIRQVRNPLAGRRFTPTSALALNRDQKNALTAVLSAVANGGGKPILLHGVTGSGKTEVYLQAIAEVLSLGKQAIVLVPEISLTPQTVERFVARFGPKVAVMHSSLSAGERYDTWWRVRRGEVSIVVGARSAVFAPFERLGLIVVDEEHENTYKQEESPKYNAVEVAVRRGEIEGAAVILGSATPSLESYYKGTTGEYLPVTLPARIDNRPLPAVEIVDMRKELASGNRTMFSKLLRDAISRRLLESEQVILFLNRRGYTTFVSCRECGHVLQCNDCNVSLVYHLDTSELICHYCNAHYPVLPNCPKCRGVYLRHFGAGTQKIEEALSQTFPGARVLRMDVDTTTQKGSHERILEDFRRGRADILLGTQMIAKGLDFPSVTLVGVIAADVTLNLPDFRAGERTFQLITQVAGRAGRGEKPGEVIIQTYNPDHYSIQAAAEHNYDLFCRHELAYRRRLGYPPFTHLIRVVVSSEEENMAIRGCHEFARTLALIGKGTRYGRLELLGPAPAPISRLRGKYRWHLILRGQDGQTLRDFLNETLAVYSGVGTTLSVDVDPMSVL